MNDAQHPPGIGGRADAGTHLHAARGRDTLRMLTLLAIFWTGGSLLCAAEPTSPAGAPPEPAKPPVTDSPAAPKPEARPDTTRPTSGAKPAAADDASKNAAGQPSPEDKPPQQSAGSEADEEAPPPPGQKGPSPQRFVPSEQVRADFDVSFPIDI